MCILFYDYIDGTSQSIVYHFDRRPSRVWSHRVWMSPLYVNFITFCSGASFPCTVWKAHPFTQTTKEERAVNTKFALKFHPPRISPVCGALPWFTEQWNFLRVGLKSIFTHECSILEKLLLIAISALFAKCTWSCCNIRCYIMATIVSASLA